MLLLTIASYKVPILFIAATAGVWTIVFLNKKTGETRVTEVTTSQSREELRKRSATALAKKENTEVTSWKRRGGFLNFTDDTAISGQFNKKK